MSMFEDGNSNKSMHEPLTAVSVFMKLWCLDVK